MIATHLHHFLIKWTSVHRFLIDWNDVCSTKVLFLIVNVNEFNTYDEQAISTRYSIELWWNSKICFCLYDITDVQNLQDVIILTVSNFVKSRSIVAVSNSIPDFTFTCISDFTFDAASWCYTVSVSCSLSLGMRCDRNGSQILRSSLNAGSSTVENGCYVNLFIVSSSFIWIGLLASLVPLISHLLWFWTACSCSWCRSARMTSVFHEIMFHSCMVPQRLGAIAMIEQTGTMFALWHSCFVIRYSFQMLLLYLGMLGF